jgi:3HB-oligomer hydrolase (3HBOH)
MMRDPFSDFRPQDSPMRIQLACCIAALSSAAAFAETKDPCQRVMAAFGSRLREATCFHTDDLTTNNPATTPQNNSLPGQPPFAFTPQTDRDVITIDAKNRPAVTKKVPGIQVNGYIADDPQKQGRFLLRLPDTDGPDPSTRWNGRLVVAGASGTRSEFNGDFAWSDYVLQQGYAYASQNKGVLNLKLSTAADPLACRLNFESSVFVHFFDNDDGQPFTRWASFMAQAAILAQRGVEAGYGRQARKTYAVGTSNGGYQVRRAVEMFPSLFDGGVDWEGTYVDAGAPNLLTDLPPAILNFPDYRASGFSASSTAAKNILAAGYPPDIVNGAASMWASYSGQFWEVTQCQWQKRLDPKYDTYGTGGAPPTPGSVNGTGTYNYLARLSASDVGQNLAAFATTGRIRRPLITVAGTMDGLLPIDRHARAYARKVAAAQADEEDDDGKAAYRLYEVQNGNHIEAFKATFAQLEYIQPHARAAFDLLVGFVEQRKPLPASQCIPHGGSIAANPAQSGHCKNLFE